MSEVYASDQYLFHVSLERSNGDDEDDRAGITELLSAIEALTAPWLRPLGIGIQFAHVDPAQYFEETGAPAQPHHFLRARKVPDGVRVWEAFSDSTVTEIHDIDRAAICDVVARGLDQPAPAGFMTTLTELRWTAVRALAPTIEPITLDVAGRAAPTVSQLIDGQLWYCGPTSGVAGPPARLRAVNDHFATSIQLEILWDLWIGHPDGRALVETGVSRVLARAGWERTA
jgi:hypothetical protein